MISYLALMMAFVCGEGQAPAATPSADADAKPPAAAAETKPASETSRRVELNLLGQTDTQAGESRRNENIQFNLIDNNALKELNVRSHRPAGSGSGFNAGLVGDGATISLLAADAPSRERALPRLWR